MALLSEASKQVILLEITVPRGERIGEANQRKRVKHAELGEQCRSNGWRARCEPANVRAGGWLASPSVGSTTGVTNTVPAGTRSPPRTT